MDVDGIGDSDVAFTYDASGQRASETFDGGQRSWVRTNGRVTGYQETLDNTLVRDATIGWNGAGQIATVTDAVASTTWSLGWDPAGQLTSIDDGTSTRTLTYTQLGQRATDTVTGAYSYDPAGQLVERVAPDTAVHTYSYDLDGRRVTETIDTVLAATYSWDDAGRLVEIDRPTTTTTLGHSTAGWLDTISHDDGTTVDTWNLTFDPHDPAVGLAAHTHPDDTTTWTIGVAGRTTALYGDDDTVDPVSRDLFDTPTVPGDLDPFGETTTTNIVADPIGYRSEVTTDELVYLRHRHYDPTTSQFLTKDPLDGVPGTPTVANPYHYTDNDPVTRTDPTGLRPEDDGFGMSTPFPASTAGGSPTSCGPNEYPMTTPPASAQILGGTYDGNYQCFPDPVVCNAGFWQMFGDRVGLGFYLGCLLPRSTSPAAEVLAASWTHAELKWGAGDLDIGCARSPHLNLAVACVHYARTFVPAFRINKDAKATAHGHFVFCKDRCSGMLLEHEVVHVGQWEDEGDRFAINYFLESQRHGTGCKNKYEIPAYEKNWPCPH